MSKIGFERFTAMSDDIGKVVAQAAGNRHMSIPWRLWELVLCRINNWGHAPFDPNELQMLACAAVGPSERRAVNRGLKILSENLGRISPDSTTLCVVVNADLWRRGAGKGKWDDDCSEPAHRAYKRHTWSATRGWGASQRDAPTGTVDVPVTTSGVPVWTPDADPWPVNV